MFSHDRTISARLAQFYENHQDRIISISAAALILFILWRLVYFLMVVYYVNKTGHNQQIDFVVFWAAAKLALEGQWHSVYDTTALAMVENVRTPGGPPGFDWRYPPTFLAFIAPFGAAPFLVSLAIFTVTGLGLFSLAVFKAAPRALAACCLAIASPAANILVQVGNCTFFWGACFLAALMDLRAGREIRAGLLIGLLTMKPQLGLGLAVALLAAGAFRTFLWAVISAACLAAMAGLLFGFEAWARFFETISTLGVNGVGRPINISHMITWFALGETFGASRHVALLIQAVATVIGLSIIARVWSRRELDFGYKVSILCLASLIVTPYAYAYELMLATLAIVFTPRMAWVWLIPLPAMLVPDVQFSQYAAPAVTLALVWLAATPRRHNVHRDDPGAARQRERNTVTD